MSGFGGSGKGDGAAGKIFANDNRNSDLEAYNSIIRTANDNLAAQQAQLKAQRDTLFMSNEEIVKAQKFQELYNQAIQEGGVSLANSLLPEIERTAAGYGRLAREQEAFQRVQDSLKTIGDLGRSVISGMYSDLRNGASGAEMFRNALDKIASKLLDMALNDLFGKAFGNNSQGLFGSGGFISSMMNFFGGGYNFNGSGSYSYGAGGYSGMGPFMQSAKGNVFGPSNVIPFARGGAFTNSIVSSPTLFPFAKGTGLMGEAGPEAIMPLRRNSAGELGVVSAASNQNSKPNVTLNVQNYSGAEVETRQRPNGDIDLLIRGVEDHIGGNIARGQGSVSTAMRAASTGVRLRG